MCLKIYAHNYEEKKIVPLWESEVIMELSLRMPNLMNIILVRESNMNSHLL